MKEEQVTVKAVEDTKETSPQEKEAAVLDAAIKEGDVNPEYGLQEDGVYKVNLDKPPKQKEDAVQKQSTNEVSVRNEPEASEEVSEQDKQEKKSENINEQFFKKGTSTSSYLANRLRVLRIACVQAGRGFSRFCSYPPLVCR